MNAVIYYSNTGQSRSIAEYFASRLGYSVFSIENCANAHYENVLLVFPVLCQNIPTAVKEFLKGLSVDNLSVIATYGKMCYGNVLYEIQNKYKKNIVSGAYLPTKHAYIENDTEFCDYGKLEPIIQKIKAPSAIRLPRLYKNPLSNVFPSVRSRAGVRLYKNEKCNNCNICAQNCSLGAIQSGVANNKCIRCLKCVKLCPNRALSVKIRLPMRLYLKNKKRERIIIYI